MGVQVRMSQDSAQDGYFLAALDSFVTRTCYANAAGKLTNLALQQECKESVCNLPD